MIRIPEYIQQLQAYKPGKAVQNVFAGKNLTRTAILSSNENNLGPSPKALAAAAESLATAHLYPAPASGALRAKLAERLGRKEEEIILGNGSDGILSNIFKAFLQPGDELLTSRGSFVAVNVMAKMNDVPLIKTDMTETYAFHLPAILQRVTQQTKAIYLCNPNNPTGAMIPRDELFAFIQKIPENILLIIDEAYADFSLAFSDDFPDTTQLDLPNLLTLRTFSKAYGLAGLRLGYAVGAPRLIEALMKVKLTFDPSSVAQAAGLAALDDHEFVQKTLDMTREGLQKYYATFTALGLPFVPSFGNFVMVDLGTQARAMQMFQALLERGVFVRPLEFFELPHCLRISVGTPDECDLLIEKITEVIALPYSEEATVGEK